MSRPGREASPDDEAGRRKRMKIHLGRAVSAQENEMSLEKP